MSETPQWFQLLVAFLSAIQPFAWPSTIFVIVLVFRRNLSGIVDRLEHARLPGGSELDFQVRQATERIRKEAEAPIEFLEPAATSSDRVILDRLKEDPAFGMAQLRMELEGIIRLIYEHKHPSFPKAYPLGLQRMIRQLQVDVVLPQYLSVHLGDVIALANRAIHGERISREAAESLGEVGIELLRELREAYSDLISETAQSWEISPQTRDEFMNASYRVTTIVTLLDNPTINVRVLTQNGLDEFLVGYEEYGEFLIEIQPVDLPVPPPPAFDN